MKSLLNFLMIIAVMVVMGGVASAQSGSPFSEASAPSAKELSPETHCLDEATNQPRRKIVSSEGGDASTRTGTSPTQSGEGFGKDSSKSAPGATGSSAFFPPPVSAASLPMC